MTQQDPFKLEKIQGIDDLDLDDDLSFPKLDTDMPKAPKWPKLPRIEGIDDDLSKELENW